MTGLKGLDFFNYRSINDFIFDPIDIDAAFVLICIIIVFLFNKDHKLGCLILEMYRLENEIFYVLRYICFKVFRINNSSRSSKNTRK
jgi:hypothetical protein